MAKGWGWKLADLMLNLYSKGLLGGQPKKILNLQEQAMRTGLEAAKAGSTFASKPMWTTGTPPAPGEQVAAGGIIPPDYKEGPTYGEAAALADIEAKSPLRTLFSQKAAQGPLSHWMKRFYGPAGEEAVSGQLYTTEPGRRLEEYLQWKLLGAAGKLQQPAKMPGEGEEEEIGEREGMSYAPGVKDLTDALLKTAFGYREKEKQPSEYTLSPGQKRFREEEEIAGVEPKPEKEETVVITKGNRKTKVKESAVAFWEKKGWKRGEPIVTPKAKAPLGPKDYSQQLDRWVDNKTKLLQGDLTQQLLMSLANVPGGQKAVAEDDEAAMLDIINKQIYRWSALQQHPDAKLDFKTGVWYVIIDGTKYAIEPPESVE